MLCDVLCVGDLTRIINPTPVDAGVGFSIIEGKYLLHNTVSHYSV